MTNEPTFETNQVKLYKKLSLLRSKMVKCDWTPSGSMKIAGNMINYITLVQMKQALAPLFTEVGLEFLPRMMIEPKYNTEARVWVVPVGFKIIDIDTGEEIDNVFYGTGSGEKGMTVALSYALKNFISATFCLADGIDPDKTELSGVSTTFVPKSAKEKEEVTSKILSQGVKPAPAPAPTPAPAPAATPEPKPQPAKTETPAPAPAPAAAPANGKPITSIQGRAIANILGRYEQKIVSGEVSATQFEEIKAEADQCVTADLARAFINKYRDKS